MRQRKFNPGDKVRILPSWWIELASERGAEHNEYVQNGIDYVYTIHHIASYSVYLDGYCYGIWDEEYLVPADDLEDEECSISIDDLI